MLPTLENRLLWSQCGLKNLMLDAQLRLKLNTSRANPSHAELPSDVAIHPWQQDFPSELLCQLSPDSLPALATQKQRAHLTGRLVALPEMLPCFPVPPWPCFLVPYLVPKKLPTSQLQHHVH